MTEHCVSAKDFQHAFFRLMISEILSSHWLLIALFKQPHWRLLPEPLSVEPVFRGQQGRAARGRARN